MGSDNWWSVQTSDNFLVHYLWEWGFQVPCNLFSPRWSATSGTDYIIGNVYDYRIAQNNSAQTDEGFHTLFPWWPRSSQTFMH